MTRQSIFFEKALKKTIDPRVTPAGDGEGAEGDPTPSATG
jgi:hypothetical protein